MEEQFEDLERRVRRAEERLDRLHRVIPDAAFPDDAPGRSTYLLAPLKVVDADGFAVMQVTADEHGTRLYLYHKAKGPSAMIDVHPDGDSMIVFYDREGKVTGHWP